MRATLFQLLLIAGLIPACRADREPAAPPPSVDLAPAAVIGPSFREKIAPVANLEGRVDHLAAGWDRDRVGPAAGRTAERRDDKEIAAAVRRRIDEADNLSRNAEEVRVTSRDGVVTLRGTVDDRGERERLKRIAENVRGVVRVEDDLDLNLQ
jgi:hypothetical protein